MISTRVPEHVSSKVQFSSIAVQFSSIVQSILSTCTQIPLIHTQRLHIFDIDRQLTIFRVTQRSPIIAHVNIYANRFYRHTTYPYCRYRQATNYFQRHTMIPYYRSCEHVCKPLLSSHNVSLLSISTGNQLFSASHNDSRKLFSRHTTSPCYRSRQHETLHRHASN